MRNTISPKWKAGKMLLSWRWWLLFHQHLQERFHWRQEQRHRPCLFRDLEFCKTGCMQIPGEAHWSPLDEPQCKDVKLTLSHFPRFLPSLESKRKFTLKKKLLSEFLVAQRDEDLALSFSCCGAGSVPGLGISICLGCSKNIFFFTAETF